MAQILDPLPHGSAGQILCCYVNATSKIQIVRISNVSNWYFERVVFPGQRLVFEAPPEAHLEVHTGMMATAILSDTIPCTRLCVSDEDNSLLGVEQNQAEAEEEMNNAPAREKTQPKSGQREKLLTVAALTSVE